MITCFHFGTQNLKENKLLSSVQFEAVKSCCYPAIINFMMYSFSKNIYSYFYGKYKCVYIYIYISYANLGLSYDTHIRGKSMWSWHDKTKICI